MDPSNAKRLTKRHSKIGIYWVPLAVDILKIETWKLHQDVSNKWLR